MKKLITLILGLIIMGPAYAQAKVDNFYKAITAAPLGGKICQMEVIYNNEGKFDSLQIKSVKPVKSINFKNLKFIKEDKRRAKPIDEANIIDYKADTLYILSTYYVQNGWVSTIIKTKKGMFSLEKDRYGKYDIYPMASTYEEFLENFDENTPYAWEKKCEIKSYYLLYSAIFNWDIDRLMRIIKSSGHIDNEPITATRIIIKDNKVIKKDSIDFESSLYWELGS